jgi:hypothetical protein
MKKVIRLTETDLVRIVKKVIKENEGNSDYEISMTINGDIEKSYTVLSIEPDIAYSKGYFMTVRDNESGKRKKFAINNHKGGMEFWLGEQYKSYPTTEKDMNKILSLFNDAGIELN